MRLVTMVQSLCVFLFVCVSLQNVFCQSEINCVIPNGDVGSCIVFQSCKHYVNVLNVLGAERATTILRKAHCGFEGTQAKVCCPIPASFSSRGDVTRVAGSPTRETILDTTDDYIPAFLDPPVCGFTNPTFNKVIGGDNTHLDDFPWMALLGYTDKIVGISWMCGGSLISERHVLTAAHCIHNLEHKLHVVRLGELDLSREDEGAHPIDILIKSMIVHEQYDANTKDNDIGILVLQKDTEFTRSIHPICLPKGEEWETKNFIGFYPYIAGWGRTTYSGKPSPHLKVAQIAVRNNSQCSEAFRAYKSQSFDQRIMCAGVEGKDSCGGDSGGPLMFPIVDSEVRGCYFYAIGIISYGRGCAFVEFPGVYTRVTQFLPWIEEKVLGITLAYRNRL